MRHPSLRHERGVGGLRREVQVARRGGDVGVAHPLLDREDRGGRDDAGAEGVARVVEAQVAQVRAVERLLVAAVGRGGVEVAAAGAGGTRSSSAVKCSRRPSRASAVATCGAIDTARI
ncbi:MAG TPA: hypothetical protein VFH80_28355 [Solirubrobacteraceae bacterium]|nr:hypothetical protein [Solirubrobacteraceae bacterium]